MHAPTWVAWWYHTNIRETYWWPITQVMNMLINYISKSWSRRLQSTKWPYNKHGHSLVRTKFCHFHRPYLLPELHSKVFIMDIIQKKLWIIKLIIEPEINYLTWSSPLYTWMLHRHTHYLTLTYKSSCKNLLKGQTSCVECRWLLQGYINISKSFFSSFGPASNVPKLTHYGVV